MFERLKDEPSIPDFGVSGGGFSSGVLSFCNSGSDNIACLSLSIVYQKFTQYCVRNICPIMLVALICCGCGMWSCVLSVKESKPYSRRH